MATLANNDVLRCTYEATIASQTCFMDMHYRVFSTGGTGSTDLLSAVALSAGCGAAIKAALPATANYWGCRLQKIWPVVQPGVFSNNANGAGSGGAGSAPTQCGAVMTKYSSLAGRKGRGRLYFGPIPVAHLSTFGTLDAGYVTLLQNIANLMFSTFVVGGGGNTSTIIACLWHRATHTFDDLIAFGPTGKVGTQRRRGDYGKPNNP